MNLTELAAQLGDALQRLGAQVSTAESCTGGGIAEAITRIAGSSAWFEAGYITYSNAQKTRQLGVPAELFEQVGAVSAEVVQGMARGAQRNSGARFAVAVSGIAARQKNRLVRSGLPGQMTRICRPNAIYSPVIARPYVSRRWRRRCTVCLCWRSEKNSFGARRVNLPMF